MTRDLDPAYARWTSDPSDVLREVDDVITRPVALLTDVPPRGIGAPGAPLATRLWPRLDDGWAGRSGVERLVALGAWLRTLHDAGPAGPSGPRPAPVAAPVAAPIDLAGLDLLHRTSLLQWARRLSAADTVVHGSLALETVREEGDGLTVLAPDGLRTAHPALDVGGLYADLVGLARRAQLAGLDPAPYERLLTAFLTGYRGLLGGRRPDGRAPSDLDTYRAAAVRLAGLAAVRSPGSEVDLELARRLVEHCWTLADAS